MLEGNRMIEEIKIESFKDATEVVKCLSSSNLSINPKIGKLNHPHSRISNERVLNE
jgi:hypothetical protein